MPIGRAIIQESNMADAERSTVFRARDQMSGATGTLYAKEIPQSPFAPDSTQDKYRPANGRLSPYCFCRRASVSLEIWGLRRISSKKLPGASCRKVNESREIPSNRRSEEHTSELQSRP